MVAVNPESVFSVPKDDVGLSRPSDEKPDPEP